MDVKELSRGLELTKREYSMHGHNTMLKEFIGHNESKLKKLQDDAKIAQVSWLLSPSSSPRARSAPLIHPSASEKDAFDEVVKFFGENAKTTPPSVFFPVFVRFVKAYRVSEVTWSPSSSRENLCVLMNLLACFLQTAVCFIPASGGRQRAEEEAGADLDGETSGTGGHAGGRPEGERFPVRLSAAGCCGSPGTRRGAESHTPSPPSSSSQDEWRPSATRF